MKVRDLSPSIRAAVAAGLKAQGRTVAGINTPARARKKDCAPFDSKLEVAFSRWLIAHAADPCWDGEKRAWRHHALTLRLPGGSIYRPDFILCSASDWPASVEHIRIGPSAHAPFFGCVRITVYEVKPRRVRNRKRQLVATKPSERAQRVAMREAVPHWPWITFIVARPDGDAWSFEQMRPRPTT